MLKKKIAVVLLSCMASLPIAVSAAESAKAPSVAVETTQTEVSAVNINTADLDVLQSELVGVGKVKAQAIIDHRNANGPLHQSMNCSRSKVLGLRSWRKTVIA